MPDLNGIKLNGIVYPVQGGGSSGVTSVNGRTGAVTLSKSDVDLNNVPNVTTDNQTPTVTEASSRTNIASGDNLATIVGKIKKFFTDLKTVAFSGSYSDLSNKPTLGTASAKDVPTSGNASTSQVVMGNDTRLSDSRPASDVSSWAKASSKPTYTKSEVGLGNVPNVSTNDQTPTFTQATTRANIASGEKLSVIFGKIMKWYADLKTVAFTGSYSDLSDKPTSMTPTSHTHGNITNGGALQTNDATIATGDKLVITDASNSNKVTRASASFDTNVTDKFLRRDGTWATPAGSGGATTWGNISGTLSNQSDLQDALDDKLTNYGTPVIRSADEASPEYQMSLDPFYRHIRYYQRVAGSAYEVCTSLSMKVLWTNPSPTANFASQSISLDFPLGNYTYICITCRNTATGGIMMSSGFTPIPTNLSVMNQLRLMTQTQYNFLRDATINSLTSGTNAISFTDCTRYNTYGNSATTVQNNRLVPYQVIGFRD